MFRVLQLVTKAKFWSEPRCSFSRAVNMKISTALVTTENMASLFWKTTDPGWVGTVGRLESNVYLYLPLAAVSMVEASSHCCDSKCPSVNQRG